MKNWANYLLVASGGIMIIAELILGAATGFDLALLGISLAAGGGFGLLFGSPTVGLFSAGALALLYLVLLRKWVRSQLSAPRRLSNVDALVGRTGVVVTRIAPHERGQVKVGEETWRAVLAPDSSGVREPGSAIKVESVDGVTLIVR